MCLAIPAKIVEFSFEDQTRALVEVAGVKRQIDTGLLAGEPLLIGDWVLVHVGFAMSKISEEQALDQIQMLTMLGEQEAILEEVTGYGLEESRAAPDS